MLHMTMVPLIEQLRVRLEEVRVEIAAKHPRVRLRRAEHPGSTASGRDYMIYLEAFFPERAPDQAERLVLMIAFWNLTTAPELEASVSWEEPSHDLEAEWQDGPVPWSLAAGSQLLADLPRLIQVFAEAVDRGYPSRP
jgi:hypothetical protein